MPGYILHLTAACMLLDTLPENNPLRIRTDLQNDFYIGNLLPMLSVTRLNPISGIPAISIG